MTHGYGGFNIVSGLVILAQFSGAKQREGGAIGSICLSVCQTQ